MITHVADIITHEIQDIGTHMYRNRIHKVIKISNRLSLQNVSVIHKYQVVTMYLTLFVHKRTDLRQASFHRAATDKVIREITSVYVTGFYQSQGYFLVFGCTHLQATQTDQSHQANKMFHVEVCFVFAKIEEVLVLLKHSRIKYCERRFNYALTARSGTQFVIFP